MRGDITFAVRHYFADHPVTRALVPVRARAVRKADGSFAILESGYSGNDPETEIRCTLDQVFRWQRQWADSVKFVCLPGGKS
ncbi:MAG: hypothetical protein KDJ76_01760 [Xanthobacteraceae bacterium]|nr:hypothetical protein [Xanthobacteraceae bacterium]